MMAAHKDSEKQCESATRVVGVRYEPGAGSPPDVILKASGPAAEQVIDRARALRKEALIVSDEKLLEQLYRLPVDAPIGPDLFELVAVLLAHVYRVEQRR